MIGAANTRASILRGTETDSYGDEVDSNVVVYTDVPMSIIERNRRVYLPAEGATRVIRSYSAQCGYEVDLRKDDRIRDQGTGIVYQVIEISDPTGILGVKPDRVVALSRTT